MTTRQTILQMKYARIIALVAERLHIGLDSALDRFYNSKTFQIMTSPGCDLHTMSDRYLADDICRETVTIKTQ